MSTIGNEISYYLQIAIDINKKIGGKRGYGMHYFTQRHKLTVRTSF